MVFKKVPFINKLLIELVLYISAFFKFLDFKLRTLFIFLNIIIFSFFLMIYVKPILDMELSKKELGSIAPVSDIPSNSEVLNSSPIVTDPIKTIPSANLVLNIVPENLYAKSVIVYDLNTKRLVFEKESKLTLPPASLVKMLSVMYFIGELNMDQKYTTFSECNFVEGQKIGYKKNEKITGKDLVYSSLIFSGGDSICNMYKITNSKIADFNMYARNLGMKNSNFTNFIGLDYPGNYTTSEDLLILTKEFIKNSYFDEIVSLKSYKMENGKVIYNTNRMLFEEKFAVGIKTGTTIGAKENLIYRHTDIEKDLDIIIIILNSGSRYQDTKTILKNLKRI